MIYFMRMNFQIWKSRREIFTSVKLITTNTIHLEAKYLQKTNQPRLDGVVACCQAIAF